MYSMPQTPHFDEYGLLIDPMEWSHELASQLAKEEGIKVLTPDQWRFINTLRTYYYEFQVPPPASQICQEMNLDNGCSHELFPNCLVAWRIAGLPDPGEEAKSYLSAE